MTVTEIRAVQKSGLEQVLEEVNAHRRRGVPSEAWTAIEETLERLFAVSRRLAVYGSLAPGEANEHELGGLEGRWLDGVVDGTLYDRGWGARLGYPAMRWDPSSRESVSVKLFASDGLALFWPRLDAFEGDGYRRILVPVRDDAGLLAVANIYELRDASG